MEGQKSLLDVAATIALLKVLLQLSCFEPSMRHTLRIDAGQWNRSCCALCIHVSCCEVEKQNHGGTAV